MKIIGALIGVLGVFSMNAAAADVGQIEEGKQVYQYWCWNCYGEGVGKPGTQALAAKYKGSKPAILGQPTDLTPALTKVFVRKVAKAISATSVIVSPFRWGWILGQDSSSMSSRVTR